MKKLLSVTIICIVLAATLLVALRLKDKKANQNVDTTRTNTQTANLNTAASTATQVPLLAGIDQYTNTELGFAIEMPTTWHARTYNDSVQDVQYPGYSVTFENTPKPLYYSDGVAPKNVNEVSLDGSALLVVRNSYNAEKLSDYLDTSYQKGMYTTKQATIGNGISATRVETSGYIAQYDPHYVVVSGNAIYTLSARSISAADEAIISKMLKSFKLF